MTTSELSRGDEALFDAKPYTTAPENISHQLMRNAFNEHKLMPPDLAEDLLDPDTGLYNYPEEEIYAHKDANTGNSDGHDVLGTIAAAQYVFFLESEANEHDDDEPENPPQPTPESMTDTEVSTSLALGTVDANTQQGAGSNK
jgi:hypothetical protein